jgi:hypothetical protein
MRTEVEDNSWEDVYRANGVRCDIEEDVSSQGGGVCPTPLAKPFFFSPTREESWDVRNIATLDIFA